MAARAGAGAPFYVTDVEGEGGPGAVRSHAALTPRITVVGMTGGPHLSAGEGRENRAGQAAACCLLLLGLAQLGLAAVFFLC